MCIRDSSEGLLQGFAHRVFGLDIVRQRKSSKAGTCRRDICILGQRIPLKQGENH